jgi:aminoglycoside 3-N-acetyltransferase
MDYLAFSKLLDTLEIKRDDILLVSSNIMHLLKSTSIDTRIIDPNIIINNIQNVLENQGTLLFPTYNWDFCLGKPFDYYKTPSKTGFLSKVALQRDDFKRTKHPIYSFAVWGKYQDYLCSLDSTDSFGPESPFDFLYKQHGKNLLIDVDYQKSFTFLHYVEESVGVTYRYIKEFTSTYIDECSNSKEKTYSMYVRNLEIETENNINPIGDIFERLGVAKIKITNDIPFIIVDLNLAFDIIKDDIINNRAKRLVTYRGQ